MTAVGLSPQAGSTVRGQPPPLHARHGKLRRQRHHGGAAEPGPGRRLVGQTQVRETHCVPSVW